MLDDALVSSCMLSKQLWDSVTQLYETVMSAYAIVVIPCSVAYLKFCTGQDVDAGCNSGRSQFRLQWKP